MLRALRLGFRPSCVSYFPDFDGMHVALRTGVHGSGRIGDSEKKLN